MFVRVLLNKRIAVLAFVFLAASVVYGAAATDEMVTDVIVGHNNKGPYALSWTNIDPANVRVVLNGMTLRKGEKYNVDYGKGLISFTSVVLSDVIVRVSYTTTPGKSLRNTSKTTVPVTLNVFQRPDASLKVTGVYSPDDPNNPDAGKTVVGVGGEKTWAQSKLTSQFFVSQRNEDDGAGTHSDSWEHSAYKVGSETTLGAFTFGGSMMHSGKEFAGGKETGLGQGKTASDLGVSFSPNSKIQASARVRQSEDAAGAAAGNKSVTQEQNVVVAPTESTRVSLAHATTETSTAAADSGRTYESTGVKVDHKLGNVATATVAATTSTVTTGAGTDTTHSQQLSVKGQKASAQVSLSQNESDTQGQATTTDVTFNAQPLESTQIKGHVATSEQGDDTQFQRDLSVVTRPWQFAKLEGSFSQKGVNEDDDVTKAAKIELLPFSHTQLIAGYKYIENGSSVMTITDYAAKTSPAKFVSFSGSLRQRDTVADDAPDSAAMQMSLAPLEYFTLTGGYQANPENKQGQVESYNATNVGMDLRFGSVGVTTGYTSKDEYLANRMSDEGKIGLEMPAFGGGTLTTGLKVSRMLDGSMVSSNTYSLGYRQDLGSLFNFSLIGYYTEYLKDKAVMPDKTEYSAEASLGVRF